MSYLGLNHTVPTVLGALSLPEMSVFRGLSLGAFAVLKDPSHPANELITAICDHIITADDGSQTRCQNTFTAPKLWAGWMACDSCREAWALRKKYERAKVYWDQICPEDFRATSSKHPDFPCRQWEALKDYAGTMSLLLIGPSRMGKTRLGMLLLKRCLINGLFVGVMWPEEVKDAANSRVRLDLIHRWGKYDLLLMDDCFLTGATDSRIVDFLKDLLDYRFRHNRAVIITSQVDREGYKDEARKFGRITGGTEAAIDAIFSRLDEKCRTVKFTRPEADGDFNRKLGLGNHNDF